MSLSVSVLRTIRRYRLIQPGDRVLVALSGGPDSVALLRVLCDIAGTEHFELAGVAHLNHQLRGEDADADEEFCRTVSTNLGLPFDTERIDVAHLARENGLSVEHAAHDARLAFFERAAARTTASVVAVGHTRDDQAETFLLRLLRGAGPRGLGGMHPRSGLVIRPLLETRRHEIRRFLGERGIEFRRDASNEDRHIPRNRVRHELLPFLEERFSPHVVEVLDREAAIARDDAEYLEKRAAEVSPAIVVRKADCVELSVPALLAEPAAIARRVIRRAQQLASGGKFVGFEAVEAVLQLAVSNSTGPVDLPGHRVNRVGEMLVLTPRVGRGPGAASRRSGTGDRNRSGFCYGLSVPGLVRIPEAACAITAETEAVPEGESVARRWPLTSRGNEVVIEGGRLAGPLVVRSRRPGDIFRPLGLKGRKTLQNFFVDAKIARTERDSVPVVVDSKGQIVWVAGWSVAEEFRVTDRTKAVVILKRVPV